MYVCVCAFDEFQKIACQKYQNDFVSLDLKKDCIDLFLGKYLSDKKELWRVCKIIFVLSHGQSFIERCFSVNKQLIDTNMKEKSLVSQRLIHDKILSENVNVSTFQISPELRKSCMLASQRYKQDLEKQKMEKIAQGEGLKRKLKCEELENLKRKKKELETTITDMRKGVETETLKADKNQDLAAMSKAAAILRAVKEKEKTLAVLCNAQENVEKELKMM